MYKPQTQLTVDTEFELMLNFQLAIESKSVIVENDVRDKHRYSLYSIAEPFPSYEEYINGDDFDEQKLIKSSSSYDELKLLQEKRRKK